MTDKEKAIAFLLATGWTPHEDVPDVYDHPAGPQIEMSPDVEWQDGTIAALYLSHKNIPVLLSPSPSLSLHPSESAFLEKAITDALAELDKLGQPHAIGCSLACAWGILKGRLQEQHTQTTQPTTGMSTPTPVEDVLRTATLFVEEKRSGMGVAPTDNARDWSLGQSFVQLSQAVDALQPGANKEGNDK